MARNRKLSVNEYGGFILGFEPERTETIESYLANEWNASESFSSQDWNLQAREMVFLARRRPKPEIFGAALLLRRGSGGATKRVNMRFAESVLFQEPISSDEAANGEYLDQLISTAEKIERYERGPWVELIQLVKYLRPASANDIDRLTQRRMAGNREIRFSTRDLRLSEQRDALGVVFDIANLDRQKIFRRANEDKLKNGLSILEVLDGMPIAERTLIERDSHALKIALESSHLSASFKDDRGRGAHIYILDSTPLETATGVDLLLYLEQFDSLLLLQYKAMEKSNVARGWSYRIDGTNLTQQLEAMNRIRNVLPFEAPRLLKHQRINSEPFYFKFCERRLPQVGDEALVAGITMSAPHLDHFLNLPEASIAGHGRRVGYENCERYLNNSEFIALARAGWIGCQGATVEAIKEILLARRDGRIAIVAVINGMGMNIDK